MKKLLIVAISMVFLFSTNIFADSAFVKGPIINETWTKDHSPYCVIGDIEVKSLLIEPSVKVVFLGNYKFEITKILTNNGG